MSTKKTPAEKKDEILLTGTEPHDNVLVDRPTQPAKVEPNNEPTVSSENVPPRVMSDNEAFIADLVKEAPQSIGEIDSVRQPNRNLLELPEECKPYHGKQFRFRWLANDKYLASKLRTSIWALCTRSNSPYIKESRFKSHGAVEQAGLLLAFTTESLAVERAEAPAKKSADLVKHYTKDLPNSGSSSEGGFYKPDSAGLGDDDEEGIEMATGEPTETTSDEK